jgi:hypothetical protein
MNSKTLFQPSDRRVSIHAAQVHGQVDGASASSFLLPVEELYIRIGDRDRTAIGMPTMAITPIAIRSPFL